jgi:hypothetical protein
VAVFLTEKEEAPRIAEALKLVKSWLSIEESKTTFVIDQSLAELNAINEAFPSE